MRRTMLFLSLITAISYPLAAHASTCDPPTCDVITISEVGVPGNVYTFTLSDSPTPVFYDDTSAFQYLILDNVAVTGPSGYSSSNDTVYFYPTATTPAGGLWDPSLTSPAQTGDTGPYGFYVDGAVLFSGDTSAPTFNVGTSGTLDSAWGGPETYNYNIAPDPEPSSLLLLGTGALGLVSVYRRRWLA